MLYPLVDGMSISTYDIGHNKITVVVSNTVVSAFPIGSVLFYMDDDVSPKTENIAPYSFMGDKGRSGAINYKPWSASTGTHRLRVELWQGTHGSGVLLDSVDVTFVVLDRPLVDALASSDFLHARDNRKSTGTAVSDGAAVQSAAISTAVVMSAIVLVIGGAIANGRRLRSQRAGEAETGTFNDDVAHSPAAAAAEVNAIQMAADHYIWDDMMAAAGANDVESSIFLNPPPL